jgi:type II secretory pathway component PulM
MNALRQWYAVRAPREQQVLLAGGIAVVLVLLFGIWFSLHSRLGAATERLAGKRSDLAWLQAQVPAMAARRPGALHAEESLVVLIDRVAHESGIASALAGSQQSGSNGFRVRLEKAPFDGMVSFLSRLAQRDGVVIESASFDATESSGIVNATLVLHKV